MTLRLRRTLAWKRAVNRTAGLGARHRAVLHLRRKAQPSDHARRRQPSRGVTCGHGPRGRLIAMICHHVRPTRWTDQRRRELEHLSQEAGRRLHDMIGTPSQSPSHRSPNGSTLNCPTIPPDSPAASSAPPSNTTSPPATSTSRSKPSHKPAEPPPPGPHRPPPRPTLDRHHDRHARTPGRIGPRSSAPRAGIRRDPVQRSLAIREIACRTGRGRRPSRGPRAPLGDADRARPPPWAFDARGGDLSGRFVLAPVRASGRRQ